MKKKRPSSVNLDGHQIYTMGTNTISQQGQEQTQPSAQIIQEDQTRMTDKNMGRVMAIINNLAINLLNSQGFANHAHARRVFNAAPGKASAIICGLKERRVPLRQECPKFSSDKHN